MKDENIENFDEGLTQVTPKSKPMKVVKPEIKISKKLTIISSFQDSSILQDKYLYKISITSSLHYKRLSFQSDKELRSYCPFFEKLCW